MDSEFETVEVVSPSGSVVDDPDDRERRVLDAGGAGGGGGGGGGVALPPTVLQLPAAASHVQPPLLWMNPSRCESPTATQTHRQTRLGCQPLQMYRSSSPQL
jgi:hypothetical protein